MDKLTICNNYLYLCGQVISLMICLVLSQKICVDCASMFIFEVNVHVCRNGARRDRVDLSISTDTKEMRIHKPASTS